jgi:hypothetical protein
MEKLEAPVIKEVDMLNESDDGLAIVEERAES